LSARTYRAAPWARGWGVALEPLPEAWLIAGALPPGLSRALADGIERGYTEGLLPLDREADYLLIRADEAPVGILAMKRGVPAEAAVTFIAVAINPAERGHAYAARALLAAEERLRGEGVTTFFALTPRTNGRGLYCLLRCGYAPLARPPVEAAVSEVALPVTWFKRAAPSPGVGTGG